MIEVRKNGERIGISFPYNPDHKDLGKIKSPLDLIMKNSDIENEVEEYED